MIAVSDTRLEDASIVLAGNFNPFIFSPEWLKRHFQFKQIALNLGAVPRGVNLHTDECNWIVDDRKLVLVGPEQKIGDLARQVVNLLPHTPLSAVGANFEFVCAMGLWQGPLPTLGGERVESLNALPILTDRWSCKINDDKKANCIRTITITHGKDQIEVGFNNHRNTENAESALTAIGYFDDDYEFSKQVVDEITGENDESTKGS